MKSLAWLARLHSKDVTCLVDKVSKDVTSGGQGE